MTTTQSRESGKKDEEPGMFSRAIAELEKHYERGEHGEETGYERPDVEEERKIDPTTLDAKDFQRLNQEFEQEKVDKLEEQHDAAAEKRKERVKELTEGHVDDKRWGEVMRRACEAAKAGQSEFELQRFPSQLCSDGGRAINVSEEGWPETLRGEPRELYERWEQDLKPQGFRLTAKILDFPDGFPGDAGLFLVWGG
jgi:hypothetical protein